MAKGVVPKLLNFVAWLTGVIVSLAVGFGLIKNTLVLPDWLGGATTAGLTISWLAGWIVVILTLLGAVLAIVNK